MARNTLEKLRDCLKNGYPEITWQPEFDRAREVLQRSLLQPAPAEMALAAAVAGALHVDGD
jgi:quinolinate synthase